MISSKTLSKWMIERIFPSKVREWKTNRIAKRTAIQAMLDANNKLRVAGCDAQRINSKLSMAVRMYDRGRYDQVATNCPAA